MTRGDNQRLTTRLRASISATIITSPRHQTRILIVARLSSRSSRYNPPTLKVRVSHEVTRLEKQCMADAFERLLPIVERRLQSRPDQCGSPRKTTPETADLTRREWA